MGLVSQNDVVPLDVEVVDSVLRSLALPFSRSRLFSEGVTLDEILESLKLGGRDLRFMKLYKQRISEKVAN